MSKFTPDFSFERQCCGPVCGVDEAGRGPLAGPVVAAAVILTPARIPEGLNDSKALSPKQRGSRAVGLGPVFRARFFSKDI